MEEPRGSSVALRSRGRNVRVAELARRQWGVLSRRQLLECGLDSGAISRWTNQGRLHRVHRGVYAIGRREIPIRGRLIAALLFAGPGAALSHQSAAWWWRILEAEPRRVHLATPRDLGSLADVRVHRRPRLRRVVHNRLPVTTPSQTLLDLAATLPFAELRRALAEADYRRVLDPSELDSIASRGRPGSTALRRALTLHLPELAETRSVLERRFLLLVERAGLAMPEPNAVVEGLMVDAVWKDARVIVELDGHQAHGTIAAAERDRDRDLRLSSAGYLLRRYTWHQVTTSPERVVADLHQALTARSPA